MNFERLQEFIEVFSQEKHGSSDYYKEEIFVKGNGHQKFAPLKYLMKKIEELETSAQLNKAGLVCDSFNLYDQDEFQEWYEYQFSRKLPRTLSKNITIYNLPDNKKIFDAIETVNKCFEVLREQHILLNNKNLPVQLGEWYAKTIFGLKQMKSSSQRGFDFYLNGKRVEIKVTWGDLSSPKGIKVRKSLVDLSDYCIVMYIARNLMVREICFLDSDFIMRKFSGKGHTVFLKDSDVGQYFFSSSSKHVDKVANSSALLKYGTPVFAMKIAEQFQ
ncbi:hypothetical protein OAT67_01670 [Bacteriovoracaceae bacterium]|nr:hypothetical protein [Bacteriovoracaceae bacterium]